MKIELVRNDEIGHDASEPKELAEGVYLAFDGTILILGDSSSTTVKITR